MDFNMALQKQRAEKKKSLSLKAMKLEPKKI
jgi:hypothetical protein